MEKKEHYVNLFKNPPENPPRGVILIGKPGNYKLGTTGNCWTVDRNRDPVTYDRWLEYLINNKG